MVVFQKSNPAPKMQTLLVLVMCLPFLVHADDIAVQEVTNANNLFASSLYKTVYTSSNNSFVLSPLSAEVALSLIQSGSKGPTGEEIRTALHLPNNKNEVESGFKTFLSTVKGNGFYTFHLLNKVYGKKKVLFKKAFKSMAKKVYRAETESIDFSKKSKAAKSMNKWVEKNTKSKIKNMVPASSLSGSTAMVVLSAFYLKANWSNPFPVFQTRKSLFYKNLYDTVFVDTMFQNEGHLLNLYESVELGAKFLELPFQGGEVSMVIALPNARDGISNLERQIERVLVPLPFVVEPVNVSMPKFKIESRAHLKNVLKAMGVNKVFEKKEADLSATAGRKGTLFVNDVLQKVYLNIGEGGIEVAATTDIDEMFKYAAPASIFTPKQFTVDHPFIYYVKVKDWIACVGRVLDPSQ